MPVVTDAPSTNIAQARNRTARVAVVRTRPERVVEDYGRVMDLAGYRDVLSRDRDTVIKLNLSWTKYFPACSSQPWQVDGTITKMLGDGFERERLMPVENKTVVTSPREGCRNNRWEPVLARHGLTFTPLTEVEWQVYPFKSPLLKLNDIFPGGDSDPVDLHRQTDPPSAHSQDPRPCGDDRVSEELVRRTPAGSAALCPQVHARGARRPAIHATGAAPGGLHGHGRDDRRRRRRPSHHDPASEERAPRGDPIRSRWMPSRRA